MATYDSGRAEVLENLQGSVGGFLAQQILQALDEAAGGQSEEVGIQNDWRPGDPVASGTDVLIVAPGSVTGNVDVPAGVSAMLFTGPAGVQASFTVSQDVSLALTGADDSVTINVEPGASVDIVRVDLGAGNDVFVGAQNAENFVAGGEGDDTMTGGNLDDIFFVGRGSDTANGGAGFDTALVEGSLSDYEQSFVDGTLTLTNKATGDITKLDNFEFVSFASGGVIVNVDNEQGFVAASLFEALLGRVPDKAGQEFYAESGASAEAIANGMLNSDEFTARHGDVDDMSDAQFVNLLYNLALDRAPDEEGLAFWLDKLAKDESGVSELSKAQVALQFGYSAEAQSKFDGLINFEQDDLNS